MKKIQPKSFEDFDSSHMEENFYNLENRNGYLDYKPIKDRLSSKYIDYSSIKDFEDFIEKAVRFLTRTAFGLYSFITEEKNSPSISLNLKSGNSFCGLAENYVQIGLEILTHTNISYQDRVDICLSTIYHEFYHKRFTIKDIEATMRLNKWESYYGNPKSKDVVEKLFPTKLHGVIHNILEDRRIEKLGALDMPGYVFAFERARRYGLFLHSDKLIRPENTAAVIIDYLLTKILLPENEENYFSEMKRYVDKGLSQFKADTRISKEDYDKYKSEWDTIELVIAKIKKHIISNPITVFSDKFEDILKETNDIYNLIPSDLREKLEKKLERFGISETGGVFNRNSGEKLEIGVDLEKILITAMGEEIKKLEEEQKEEQKSKGEKVKNEKINSKDNFTPYTHYQIIESQKEEIDSTMLSQARRISKNIFENLGFLDSKYKRQIESYELSEGEIDETDLYSIGFGNNHIFEEIDEIEQYSLDFGILLDESGSMRNKIREAKLAVLSLLLALKDNRHINLFVYGHTANHKVSTDIQIYKYFNTIEHFTDWSQIFSAASRSNNADGFAIAKIGEIMMKSKSKNKILIVVSDGQPAADGYGGDKGVIHTRQQVELLEAKGFTVIQICMDNIENSAAMFKHFIPYEEDGRFFYNLKDVLLKKLVQFSDAI